MRNLFKMEKMRVIKKEKVLCKGNYYVKEMWKVLLTGKTKISCKDEMRLRVVPLGSLLN